MNISKNLVHAFLGIFLGNFIAVAILMLSKHEDYMRFWNWGGFIIFPFIILIIFILMLGIYILINKFFKINFTIPSTHFSTIGGLFGFFYILGEFFIINPFVNKIGGNIKSSFIFYLSDPGIPYFFFPLILFPFTLLIYFLFKNIFS